jgi:hypothetical protein
MIPTFLKNLQVRIKQQALSSLDLKEKISALTVTDEIRNQRQEICNSCEFLLPATEQCGKCKCFIKIHTAMAPVKCPVDKWTAQ